MFAHTTQTSADAQARLRGEIASLQEAQARYQQAEAAAAAQSARLNQELSSARDALTRLAQQHDQIKVELAEAQAKLQPPPQTQSSRTNGSPVAFIDVKPRPAPQDVVAAQKALTELGYGPLKADGALGRGMREAIEKYQRDAGLTVTGELHAETLQVLLDPAKRLASQD